MAASSSTAPATQTPTSAPLRDVESPAIVNWNAFDELNINVARIHLKHGYAAFLTNDIKSSVTSYEQAANILPEDPYVNYALALAYRRQGNLRKARSSLKKAAFHSSGFIDAYYQLGDIYRLMGGPSLEKARRCFIAEIKRYPTHGRAYQALSEVLASMGERQKSMEAARRAAQYGYRQELGPALAQYAAV